MQKYLLTIWQHLITPPIYPNTLNFNRSSCLFLRDFNSNRLWSKFVQLANSKHDSFQTTLEQMSIHSCCPLLIIKTTNILIMMVLVCEAVLVFGEIEIGHWALFAKIATSPLCPNETDSKDPWKVHQRTPPPNGNPSSVRFDHNKSIEWLRKRALSCDVWFKLINFFYLAMAWLSCARAQQERIKLGDWNGLAYGRSIILRYTPIPRFSPCFKQVTWSWPILQFFDVHVEIHPIGLSPAKVNGGHFTSDHQKWHETSWNQHWPSMA